MGKQAMQCQQEPQVWHAAGQREGRETARVGFPGPRLAVQPHLRKRDVGEGEG